MAPETKLQVEGQGRFSGTVLVKTSSNGLVKSFYSGGSGGLSNWKSPRGIVTSLAAEGADGYAYRFTGAIKPPYSETYTFYCTSDDGCRVYVNGTLLVNDWVDSGCAEVTGSTIALTADVWYEIRIEYYENAGGECLDVSWSSPSLTKRSISTDWNRLKPGFADGYYGDIAEIYPLSENQLKRIKEEGRESLEAGSLISIDEASKTSGYIKEVDRAYDPKSIGVVSFMPAVLIKGSETLMAGPDAFETLRQFPDEIPVALSGRVPVRISSSSEEIKPGDYLTSANEPGKAMKATKAGPTIGKAMGSWDPADPRDSILAFVNPSWYDPDVFLTLTEGLFIEEKAEGKGQNYNLKNKTGEIIERVGAFSQAAIANVRAGIIEAKKLVIKDIDILDKLHSVSDTIEEQQRQLEEQYKLIGELKGEIEKLKQPISYPTHIPQPTS